MYSDAYAIAVPSALWVPGPIEAWSLSVVAIGGAVPYWRLDLEVSNDDATWTPILTHRGPSGAGATASGKMVFAPHSKAVRARLNLVEVGTGTRVTATAFAGP